MEDAAEKPQKCMKKIIAVVLVCVMLVSLVGCSFVKKQETPEEVLTAFVDAFKNGDSEAAAQRYHGDVTEFFDTAALNVNLFGEPEEGAATPAEQMKLVEDLHNKIRDFDYEIKAVELSEDETAANIEVQFTSYDFLTALENVVDQYVDYVLGMAFTSESAMDEDAMLEDANNKYLELLVAGVDSLTAKNISTAAVITLSQNDEGIWLVNELDESVIDAVLGGLIFGLVESEEGEEPSVEEDAGAVEDADAEVSDESEEATKEAGESEKEDASEKDPTVSAGDDEKDKIKSQSAA